MAIYAVGYLRCAYTWEDHMPVRGKAIIRTSPCRPHQAPALLTHSEVPWKLIQTSSGLFPVAAKRELAGYSGPGASGGAIPASFWLSSRRERNRPPGALPRLSGSFMTKARLQRHFTYMGLAGLPGHLVAQFGNGIVPPSCACHDPQATRPALESPKHRRWTNAASGESLK